MYIMKAPMRRNKNKIVHLHLALEGGFEPPTLREDGDNSIKKLSSKRRVTPVNDVVGGNAIESNLAVGPEWGHLTVGVPNVIPQEFGSLSPGENNLIHHIRPGRETHGIIEPGDGAQAQESSELEKQVQAPAALPDIGLTDTTEKFAQLDNYQLIQLIFQQMNNFSQILARTLG